MRTWLESVDESQLLKYTKEFEDLGCNYLEYLLLLRNKEGEIMEVPVVFVDHLKSNRWNDIYMRFGGVYDLDAGCSLY